MVKGYKTMKWVETLSTDSDEDDRLTAYECKVCHGVLLVRCADAGKLTCMLCDESAPLPERYRMAVNTMGWLSYECPPPPGYVYFRSASFKSVIYDDEDGQSTWAVFDYEQATVVATLGGFTITVGGEEKQRWFGDDLDAGGDKFTPRILAQEVVDRVRHDLKLEYGGNAGLGTRTLQDASRESREA